ncbi:MAG: hypothetical protein ABSF59_01795 [Candidatus Sulfotelmatobacter sp.]
MVWLRIRRATTFLFAMRGSKKIVGSPLAGIHFHGARTLDYFIAHEITHQLTGHALGPIRYFQLPRWVREGHADYVGKGSSFNYIEAREAFRKEAPEMGYKRSGLYWRFHLWVAHLLDRQGRAVSELLRQPPSQADVEAAVREEKDGTHTKC